MTDYWAGVLQGVSLLSFAFNILLLIAIAFGLRESRK